MRTSNSQATRRPDSEMSATRSSHSRFQLSITVRMRKRRPPAFRSDTKSRFQRGLAASHVSFNAGAPMARLRLPH